METKARVLVPLYSYPVSDKTWQPLYEAISSHPNVDFLVIVNPESGPGAPPLPDQDYVREVPKLNAQPNVCTVGYVRINYCKKPLRKVYDEIETYARWAEEKSSLGVKGIFLDETPSRHSTDRAEYLAAVRMHIKVTDGIMGDRLVIHNPGTPPDAGLADTGPDVIVTCEEPYHRYKSKQVQKTLKDLHYDQARSSYIISAVPADEIGPLVRELLHRGAYLFATDLVEDIYESFGDSWGDFVTAFEVESK